MNCALISGSKIPVNNKYLNISFIALLALLLFNNTKKLSASEILGTINFPVISDQSYSTNPIKITLPTSSSGEAVSTTVFGPAKLSGDLLTLSGVGNVTLVAQSYNKSMHESSSTNNMVITIATNYHSITKSGSGDIYVSDFSSVSKIDPNGNPSIIYGDSNIQASLTNQINSYTKVVTNVALYGGLVYDSTNTNTYYYAIPRYWLTCAADINGTIFVGGSASVINGYGDVGICYGDVGILEKNGICAHFFTNFFGDFIADNKGGLYSSVWDQTTDTSYIQEADKLGNLITIAGGKSGFKDGFGKNAAFRNPSGMTIDKSGNLFVVDTGNNAIRKIDSKYQVATVAGGTLGFKDGFGTNAAFRNPCGIAIDKSGNLFVADSGNGAIRKITTNNYVLTLAFNPIGLVKDINTNAPFYNPTDIEVDNSNNIYLIDGSTFRIIRQEVSNKIDYSSNLISIANIFSVSKGSQTITFIQPPSQTYSPAGSFYLPATAPGGVVTFSSAHSNIVSISGASAIIHGAGTVTITANQSGNNNYLPAKPISRTVTVSRSAQAISFDSPSAQTYSNNATVLLKATAPGGTVIFSSSNPQVITISGSKATLIGPGSAVITATQPGNSNYLPAPAVSHTVVVNPPAQFKISSPDFAYGTSIPQKYAFFIAGGNNISPELDISGVPTGTKSLYLILHDPDAPDVDFTHWLIWNISPNSSKIAEGTVPAGAVQGRNGINKYGYVGPFPPSGSKHRYFFDLYALDTVLGSDPNMTPISPNSPHILKKAQYMGTFTSPVQ
jgi:Raf kinase inhibitor-like YbhB/YbcL family protein